MISTAEKIDYLGPEQIQSLIEENNILRKEIRVARESAEITASLVVKQFEETERILRRFQIANAQRKAVLDSAAQMAIIATDKYGKIVVFNKGAENFLGYNSKEIVGMKTPEVFHLKTELATRRKTLGIKTAQPSNGLDILFGYATQGRYEQEEWNYIRKDGTEFPVSMSINALYGPEGTLDGILCIASDITEKKRSEKALVDRILYLYSI